LATADQFQSSDSRVARRHLKQRSPLSEIALAATSEVLKGLYDRDSLASYNTD
jgi:hypothetical protein